VNDVTLLPEVPVEITALRFRRDNDWGDGLAKTLPDVSVTLGTASVVIGQVFDDNFTGDQRVIHTGAIDVPATGADPLAFDAIEIAIDPPFAYDPSVGKLLVEFQVADNGGEVVWLDCNNDGDLYMYMTSMPFDPINGAPAEGNNATGCAYAMQLGLR
jgi:hypothetical protein